jgi:DNA helicase-4
VDEYQDIAPSRVTFLQALIRSSPAHLLCVGDDWQSIYGFNGSNVGFILNFEKFWGNATVNKIEKTYRFSQSLVDILGAFVMANPHQVKKQIRGHTNLQGCAIRVLFADEKNPLHNIIAQTLEGFPINSTVFLIGRFQKDLDTIVNERDFFETTIDKEITSITYCRRTDLRIRFLTAHASKGLEADNVIIINAKDGMFGFPSKIPNHPLVDLLQGQQHLYPYDEERRLFYVAATRTRNRTYIVCERSNKSAFVNEIINKYPDVLDSNNHICPLCGAPLIEVEDLLGNDWACKNYSDGTCNYRRDSVWMPPRKS